jgi:hypothetical protein
VERVATLGEKEFYTEQEMKDRAAARALPQAARDVGVHYDNAQFGLVRNVTPDMISNRTSIITGKTGRKPALIPSAKAREDGERAAVAGKNNDGIEFRSMAERCVYWGAEGPPMMPGGYNDTLQIHQGPGYVAIEQEMAHVVRLIPTDGRGHAPDAVRNYFGDAIGHWEGDTLVVETTNFADQPSLRDASRNLRVTERLTMTGPKTIKYQFTVSDPSTWEQSWSGEYLMGKIDGALYEYACQEANHGVANILKIARADEKKAADAAAAAAQK